MEKNAKYPAVDTAYALSVESMKIAINRFDSQSGNLDKLITFISSFSVAIIGFLSASHESIKFDYQSTGFRFAVLFFILSLLSAFYGKVTSGVVIPNPKKLYPEIMKNDEEFKREHVWFLGENFEKVKKRTSQKWCASILALGFFALEIALISAELIKGS